MCFVVEVLLWVFHVWLLVMLGFGWLEGSFAGCGLKVRLGGSGRYGTSTNSKHGTEVVEVETGALENRHLEVERLHVLVPRVPHRTLHVSCWWRSV